MRRDFLFFILKHIRGRFKDQKQTQLRFNFSLLFLTCVIYVDLTYIDNGLELNFISTFWLQNLETDQDAGAIVQTNLISPINAIAKAYCCKVMIENIFL